MPGLSQKLNVGAMTCVPQPTSTASANVEVLVFVEDSVHFWPCLFGMRRKGG